LYSWFSVADAIFSSDDSTRRQVEEREYREKGSEEVLCFLREVDQNRLNLHCRYPI
jgi:hypothetical protein